MLKTGIERAKDYVDQVLSGEILAPELVKCACRRYLGDFDNPKIYFDEPAADKAIRNLERFPHTKGTKQGEPIRLEPWQCFLAANIFGWKWKHNDKRRFRKVYIRVPRKNGKTTTVIPIALLLFGPDGEKGAEVYLGAIGKEHANDLLFKPAKYMVTHTPKYQKHYGVEINAQNMIIPETFGELKALIKKPPDGTNPHCAIIDEYHEHEDDEQFATFDTGMGSREQPLMLVVTTAGANLAGPCKEFDDECIEILEGKQVDDTVFALIYALDKGDDWTDFNNWVKVNPNAGVSISLDYLEAQRNTALRSPSKQNELRTKHLNEWVGAATSWLNILLWQRQSKPRIFSDFDGARCFGGVDLASRNDCNAVCLLFKNDENNYYAKFRFYVPEAALEKNPKYKTFSNSGDLIVTPGNKTDQARIEADIVEFNAEYGVESWAFDDYQGDYLMTRCEDQGLDVVNFGSTVKNFSAPMKEVEALIEEGELFNDGNACQLWMMGNVMCFRDQKDNVFPRKANKNDQKSKIDGPVALIMAMGMWLADDGAAENIGIDYA